MLDIRLGPSQSLQDLVVFPLLSSESVELPYVLLSDAIADGSVRITERGSGSVPTLRARNLGTSTVLVLDGEQLIGAKQNRTTNRSILLAGKAKTDIPVSCMEQGRWRSVSRDFTSSPHHSPARVRRRARDLEALHARTERAPATAALAEAQGAVWGQIDELAGKLNVRSSTSALDAAYTARAQDLGKWTEAFPVVEGQVGLLVLTRRAVVGLDVIGGHRLYARLHGRLLQGYLMDGLASDAIGGSRPYRFATHAADPREADGAQEELRARHFMEQVAASNRTEAPTVGLGTYTVLSRTAVGGELVDQGRLAHLSAFASQQDEDKGKRIWRM